jgi:transcriptional regulator with XRE-family HTH domain
MPDRGVSRDVGDDADYRASAARPASAVDKSGNDISGVLGANLRRLRARSGLSLEKLASLSGVSRGMIGRIEMGRSTPTIGLLSLLAEALEVQLVSLIAVRDLPPVRILRHGRSARIETSGGKFVKRPVSGRQADGVEFFEVAIAPGHIEPGDRQAAGIIAHVVVGSGRIVVTVAGEQPAKLAARDAIVFAADAEHSFQNAGDQEAILYVSLSGNTNGA